MRLVSRELSSINNSILTIVTEHLVQLSTMQEPSRSIRVILESPVLQMGLPHCIIIMLTIILSRLARFSFKEEVYHAQNVTGTKLQDRIVILAIRLQANVRAAYLRLILIVHLKTALRALRTVTNAQMHRLALFAWETTLS